jgi:hypothetical protein
MVRRHLVRAAAFLVAASIAAVADACTEQLEGGKACPILCPEQEVELLEDTVDAVALDTTLEAGYPDIGQEPVLLLTSRGDTLDTRVIIRYDTLPSTYTPSGSTSETDITFVDSARLKVRLQFPMRDSAKTVTLEAYDVDTTVAEGEDGDTTAASMLPLFRPDRFLGSATFVPAAVHQQSDSSVVAIVIDSVYLLAKIQAKGRLRVGLLVRGNESIELPLQGLAQARPESLTFRPSSDKAVAVRAVLPHSATPSETFVSANLGDFVIVARQRPPDAPSAILTVGGLPGRRTYLRFNLPPRIVDSTNVVRATLLLTQYPNRLAAQPTDSVVIFAQPVLAAPVVTELTKAATLLGDPRVYTAFRLDTLRKAVPADSGAFGIELAGLVAGWRGADTTRTTRAIVLRLPNEGISPDALYFFSTRAAPEVRPRLRLVYAPRINFALP